MTEKDFGIGILDISVGIGVILCFFSILSIIFGPHVKGSTGDLITIACYLMFFGICSITSIIYGWIIIFYKNSKIKEEIKND